MMSYLPTEFETSSAKHFWVIPFISGGDEPTNQKYMEMTQYKIFNLVVKSFKLCVIIIIYLDIYHE